MSTETLSKEYGSWSALNANVKTRLPELAHLGDPVSEMDSLLGDIQELQSVQDVHRRQLRETTEKSRELLRRGRLLRNRLVAGVQSAYGHDSVQMVEFGIKPRVANKRNRKRKPQVIAATAATEPAADAPQS